MPRPPMPKGHDFTESMHFCSAGRTQVLRRALAVCLLLWPVLVWPRSGTPEGGVSQANDRLMARRAKNVWPAFELVPRRGPGVRIVNFATGFLEVRKEPTHLTVGPSHRTDRPALASQDEISSQEGRTDAVRPSCVI
jgi:hypothetical protein